MRRRSFPSTPARASTNLWGRCAPLAQAGDASRRHVPREPDKGGVSAQYAPGAALRDAVPDEVAVVLDDLGRDAGDLAVVAPDERGEAPGER